MVKIIPKKVRTILITLVTIVLGSAGAPPEAPKAVPISPLLKPSCWIPPPTVMA